MSRLDDELRRAFRREEPSPDFTARVMKAVASAPAPRRHWWDELLALFATPRGRWVTVGAAVSLLALIVATQYSRLEEWTPKEAQEATHVQQPVPTPTGGVSETPAVAQDNLKAHEPQVKPSKGLPHTGLHPRVRRDGPVSATPEVAKSEGEVAKDQLMLALHIASSSLNEAQRMVRESEGNQPRTVTR